MNYKDDEEIVSTFVAETIDHLEELEHGVLKLENNTHHGDSELVHSMFRAAHSIKAGANLLEYRDIELLSHAMENILQKLRLENLILDSELATVYLQAIDTIRMLVGFPQAISSVRISILIQQLQEAID
ncbi:MAG: chemotaxis protein CheA [Deltaproteobacteria bacterium]|nr:chemotaxis protein CheA [Deltaproteobacteria bacterium]MBT4263557.1 chemotaxis protein CheA [Deltaproteobacteria bacterium]MBT4644669.1 chemotaxis protein CheA [Deltaproteobacteria bacterium]MBT6502785.1 chemotaxis protein CheA [Deltaproteobacteria bacterium]MBT7152578.1 chemotaxis protein CheA [Deltaproteobacteria bacterium]